ncbi:MAG: hypothetical protein DMG91_18235 [Acidobacteria bacterium]|nr:MAG: hypothetical protein DMG91_18235 [Acidobacteriota bacterium]
MHITQQKQNTDFLVAVYAAQDAADECLAKLNSQVLIKGSGSVLMQRVSKRCWRGLIATLAFVACLQAQTLKRIGTIDLPGRKVYTSDWGEEKIGVVDLRTMRVIKRLATAAKPNGSTYAPAFHKVYVSDTLGKALAIVDVNKDEIIKTLDFKSETGMPQYDSVAPKV